RVHIAFTKRLTCTLTLPTLCSIIGEVGSAPAETRWMTAGQPGSFAAPSALAPGKTGPSTAAPAPEPGSAPGPRSAPGPGPGPGPAPAPAPVPVLPALRGLLPRGGLARGSVVAVAEFGLLCLAL